MFILATIASISVSFVDIEIQQVVPDTTIAVVSTNSVSEVIEHIRSSGVCDTFGELITSISKQYGKESLPFGGVKCDEIFSSLGLNRETWVPPTGSAGFAIYPAVDYEVGTVGLGVLAMLQLDEDTYGDLFANKFEDFLVESGTELDTVNLSGRDVWMIQLDMESKSPVPQLNIDPNAFNRIYVVYSDGYLLIGTEPGAIASAFAAIDGSQDDKVLADNADYAAMADRCGMDGDVFAAVLLTNLADVIVQMDSSGMAMMFLPMVKGAFGDIDGLAQSVHISPSPDVFVDTSYTALMNDGRSGMMSLFGSNTKPKPIPNFVQADAFTYTQGQIDLKQVVPLIKDVIMANPMFAMQMGTQIEQMEAGLNLFLNPLGSAYHSYSTGQLPFNMDSVGYLFAVECTDEEAFTNALGESLPMMGATPSDFLGNQIFTVDLGAMSPIPTSMPLEMSIAVGGGYALMGSTNTVENALRSIANPKDNKVIHDTNDALSMLSSDDVSSWGYGNIRKSIEIQTAMSKAMTDAMLDEMQAFDPEMAAEMQKEFEDQSAIQEKITNALSAMLGHMAWNVTADDKGLNAHTILMKSVSE